MLLTLLSSSSAFLCHLLAFLLRPIKAAMLLKPTHNTISFQARYVPSQARFYHRKSILQPQRLRKPVIRKVLPLPAQETTPKRWSLLYERFRSFINGRSKVLRYWVAGTACLYSYILLNCYLHRRIVPITDRHRFAGGQKANLYFDTALKQLSEHTATCEKCQATLATNSLPDDHPLMFRLREIFEKVVTSAGRERHPWRIRILVQPGMGPVQLEFSFHHC